MTAEPVGYDVLPEITEGSVNHFLRTVAVKTFDDMDAHPERNLTTDQVQANLDMRHAAQIAAE